MTYPKYDLNKYLKSGLAKADYIKALYSFVEPELKNKKELEKTALTDRIRGTLKQEGIECDFNSISRVLENNKADDKLAKHVNAFLKTQKYIGERLNEFNLSHLRKGHEILLRGSANEKFGGILRSAVEQEGESNYELPGQDQLVDLTTLLLTRLKPNEYDNHPFIKAFTLYLLFDIIQPFIVFNQGYSLLFFNELLNKYGYGMGGLLTFEKYVLLDWNTHKSIKLNSLFPVSAKERLDADLTAFLENCTTILLESFIEIEENLITSLKDSINYKALKPIQKNSFNYLIKMGFPKYYDAIGQLNERQQAILRDVAFSREVTTKTMVMKYRCDRKTIQRDFADMMDIGIMSQEGKTKTIIYHLSFK